MPNSMQLTKQIPNDPGADPGFEKGGGAVGSGARSQDFFGQFRGLLKTFGAKSGGLALPCAPPLDPRLWPSPDGGEKYYY